MRLPVLAACLLAFGSIHCASADISSTSDEQDLSKVRTSSRDWKAHPAIVEIDVANDVYALSDVHGHYDMFVGLLARNRLVDHVDANPKKVSWTGGSAILVIAGDMIDKGGDSLRVLDLIRTLEANAPKSGGRVVATMGNHEAEFMLDPENHKAASTGEDREGINQELLAASVPPKSVAQCTDPQGRGAWIAGLPFGVRVKKWFFSHGGNTGGRSLKDLAAKLQNGLDANGYGDKAITGDKSILEAQEWYGDPNANGAGRDEADALGVKHIVFGHDPGAFGEHGRMRTSKNGILVKIDTAMGIHRGSTVGGAFLLHIKTQGTDTAEILDESGASTPLR